MIDKVVTMTKEDIEEMKLKEQNFKLLMKITI